jgi:hypothetical protein
LVNPVPELRNGVSGQVQPEGQLANLVRDEAGHSLHLHNVGVSGTNLSSEEYLFSFVVCTNFTVQNALPTMKFPCLHEQTVGLPVVLVCRVQVPLELVEQARLELMTDKEVEMGRLVQVVAVGLDGADLLENCKNFKLRQFHNSAMWWMGR